jgi:very-short-patch-repair endonuclease
MTSSERRLWRELKKLDLNFRRQAPIGAYFADFACLGRKLVIEVDGAVHELFPEVAARDAERQLWLEGQGYAVLRFATKEIEQDIFAVMAVIEKALLLDGGGLGGGGRTGTHGRAPVGAGAQQRSSLQLYASTTIPGPSSIEEEGRGHGGAA